MAREERDREDLLRDGRALVPRALWRVELHGREVEALAGFRNRALSLFFDQDPVYHFNVAGQLRRAFVGGQLIKAERRRLVGLTRVRSAEEVVLARNDLDEAAEQTFLDETASRLAELAAALNAGRFTLIGQEPPDVDVASQVAAWLAAHQSLEVAAAPRL